MLEATNIAVECNIKLKCKTENETNIALYRHAEDIVGNKTFRRMMDISEYFANDCRGK